MGNIVIVPMAVPAALDGDVPAPRAAEGRQGLDGCGDFLRVFGLEDAPGENFLDGEAPVALESEGVVAAWAGGEEEAGAEAGFDEGVALGELVRKRWDWGRLTLLKPVDWLRERMGPMAEAAMRRSGRTIAIGDRLAIGRGKRDRGRGDHSERLAILRRPGCTQLLKMEDMILAIVRLIRPAAVANAMISGSCKLPEGHLQGSDCVKVEDRRCQFCQGLVDLGRPLISVRRPRSIGTPGGGSGPANRWRGTRGDADSFAEGHVGWR